MDEASTKRRIQRIVARMRVILSGSIDGKVMVELQVLANELDELECEISDSKLRKAVKSAVDLVAGGLAGYGIERLADYLTNIEALL